MKVRDFNGREYNWPPAGHVPLLDETRPRSELHLRVRAILRAMYPTAPILEEVPIPGTGLIADFYLPLRKVVIECHGAQHFAFTPHFHGDRRSFIASRNRDQKKIDWCHLNNIHVAILPHTESNDDFRKRIEEAKD